MTKQTESTCPVCGGPVRHVSSDEGTQAMISTAIIKEKAEKEHND